MTSDDDEPTAEELADAERLARALERGHSAEPVPDEALATAALLRFSRDGGALSAESAERIFEEALSGATPARRKLRWGYTLFGLLGLAAAGAASVTLVVRSQEPEPAALPEPPRALLDAQVAAASIRSSLATLDDETTKYREAFYAKLRKRYDK